MNQEHIRAVIQEYSCTHIAFWKYDLYPFLIGSPVNKVEVTAEGHIKVYAPLYSSPFRAVFVTDDIEDGLAYLAQLEELQQEYRDAKRELESQYKAKLQRHIPFAAGV